MGYPSDIEDADYDVLISEIQRRNMLTKNNLCAYCSQDLSKHTCKYKDREFKYNGQQKESYIKHLSTDQGTGCGFCGSCDSKTDNIDQCDKCGAVFTQKPVFYSYDFGGSDFYG